MIRPMENLQEHVLNAKETILKKIDASFMVYLSLDKYTFSLNTFQIHLIYIMIKKQ